MTKCKCFICKTEGEIKETTDIICRPCYSQLEAQIKQLEADNERLREALRGINRLLIYKKEILEKVEQALKE